VERAAIRGDGLYGGSDRVGRNGLARTPHRQAALDQTGRYQLALLHDTPLGSVFDSVRGILGVWSHSERLDGEEGNLDAHHHSHHLWRSRLLTQRSHLPHHQLHLGAHIHSTRKRKGHLLHLNLGHDLRKPGRTSQRSRMHRHTRWCRLVPKHQETTGSGCKTGATTTNTH